MYANNETGTIQPVRDIGAVCKARGVFFHTDATQAVGKVPIDVDADGIDLLSLSAHKLYGPKGCGALFVRRKGPRVRLAPLFDGGGHERGYRSGTLNVSGIVGLGMACELAGPEMAEELPRLAGLRDRLEGRIIGELGRVFTNGDVHHRLPQVSNLSFAEADGSSILRALDDIAVSSGSACTSASLQASHVLRAMGLSDELAYNSIRFSLGRFTTEADVDYVTEKIVRIVRGLRGVGTGGVRGFLRGVKRRLGDRDAIAPAESPVSPFGLIMIGGKDCQLSPRKLSKDSCHPGAKRRIWFQSIVPLTDPSLRSRMTLGPLAIVWISAGWIDKSSHHLRR